MFPAPAVILSEKYCDLAEERASLYCSMWVWYISMWMVSPVFLDRRSSWRHFAFNWRSCGENQGAERGKVTVRVLRGASEFRRVWSSLLYDETSCSGLHGEGMEGKHSIPVWRSVMLMFFILRKDMVRGGLDLDNVRLKLNETSMWSEMGRQTAEQLRGVTPVQQTMSKI